MQGFDSLAMSSHLACRRVSSGRTALKAESVDLINELAIEHAYGRPAPRDNEVAAIRRILEIDPPSARRFRKRDVPGFVGLARDLRDSIRLP
jgi:hypothetical protein